MLLVSCKNQKILSYLQSNALILNNRVRTIWGEKIQEYDVHLGNENKNKYCQRRNQHQKNMVTYSRKKKIKNNQLKNRVGKLICVKTIETPPSMKTIKNQKPKPTEQIIT